MTETKTPDIGPFFGPMGIWTRRAIEFFKEGKHGDTITVDKMTEIVGRDCRTGERGRPNVDSAIRNVIRNYGICWRWIRDVQAWKCLNDSERVEVIVNNNKRAYRASGRNLQVVVTVDETELSESERNNFLLATATAGVMRLCGSSQFRKKLADSNGAKLTEPDVGRLIELMKR